MVLSVFGIGFGTPTENYRSGTEEESERMLSMKKLAENLELYFDHLMKEKESKKAHAKRAVLWVDDRPENNRLERSVLEQYGMEFTLALSTQQALQCIKYNRFDLVISDMGRKEGAKEGYVLLEEIRKRDRKMPFLIYASEAC